MAQPRLSSIATSGLVFALVFAARCGPGTEPTKRSDFSRMSKYTTVRLTTDLSGLSERERRMIPLLIEAAREMEEVFWLEAYGEKSAFLSSISNPDARRYAEINFGPWDRLEGDEPFLDGFGAKPPGANFYPPDMTKAEFETALADQGPGGDLSDLYTLVRREDQGRLVAVPYHEVFAAQHRRAAEKLQQAAQLADDPGLRRYLELRAEALLTDNYQPSDMAWMDMKQNTIDVVIGPIETYEDQLFGYKAAHEAFVLVKDLQWSERLARYTTMLPSLQRGLPVPEAYKQETPGMDSDLNAYDAIYYAGDCNAGSKTIAINLPNDEQVQLEKGTRRLQLKNSMRAKFEKILTPIAQLLIEPEQLGHVTFEAFFSNTMFHEVAHGLGIKNTLTGKGTVRQALRDQASTLEEGKADVLGLYMVTQLHEQGELADTSLEDHYVTFVAGLFRAIRFGASSAHGRANLSRFNFFKEMGAFSRDPQSGTYRVDFAKMREAIDALSEKILRLQGDGDAEGAAEFVRETTRIGSDLRSDLDRLAGAGIPVDIVFEQGPEVLGIAD